jgi:hypothetical protein
VRMMTNWMRPGLLWEQMWAGYCPGLFTESDSRLSVFVLVVYRATFSSLIAVCHVFKVSRIRACLRSASHFVVVEVYLTFLRLLMGVYVLLPSIPAVHVVRSEDSCSIVYPVVGMSVTSSVRNCRRISAARRLSLPASGFYRRSKWDRFP